MITKQTTNFQYVSGNGVKRGELPGHLSESEVQRTLLSQKIGCRRVFNIRYNGHDLVRIGL